MDVIIVIAVICVHFHSAQTVTEAASVVEGFDAALPCPYRATPLEPLQWYIGCSSSKDQIAGIFRDQVYYILSEVSIHLDPTTSTLTIKNTHLTNESCYSCEQFPYEDHNINLIVYEAVSVVEGFDATLLCPYRATLLKPLQWYIGCSSSKDQIAGIIRNQVYYILSEVYIHLDPTTSTLIIKNTHLNNESCYTCEQTPDEDHNISLIVYVTPSGFTEDIPSGYLEENTTVNIGCEVGRVKPSIDSMEWLVDIIVIGSTDNWEDIDNGDGTIKQTGTFDMYVKKEYHTKTLKCKVTAFGRVYISDGSTVNVGLAPPTDGDNMKVIVGAAVVAVILITVISIVVVFVVRRKHSDKKDADENPEATNADQLYTEIDEASMTTRPGSATKIGRQNPGFSQMEKDDSTLPLPSSGSSTYQALVINNGTNNTLDNSGEEAIYMNTLNIIPKDKKQSLEETPYEEVVVSRK